MNGRKVLVVTSSHLCRNPRVVKEAAALATAGYDVTVLNVAATERFAGLDAELARTLPFRRDVLDFSARRGAPRFAQRAATWLARKLCAGTGLQSAQALGPASALLSRARASPADLMIMHNEIPLWAASRLARDGRRVAVDFEDWYSEDLLPADRRSRPLRLLRRAEAFALAHGVYTSATSRSMAEALTAAYAGAMPVVVRNVFPLQPHTRLDRPAANMPGFIWFSQTVGPGRGLEAFVSVWAQTKNPSTLSLIGDVRSGYHDELLSRVPAARRDHVRFHPPVPPAELPEELAGFDLGLAVEPGEPRNKDVTISNKLFQYLNAGLAVVATPTAGQREVMAAAPGCGLLVALERPAGLAAQLDALLADATRLRAMQAAARAAAEREFCWEREASRLLGAVERALAVPPRK